MTVVQENEDMEKRGVADWIAATASSENKEAFQDNARKAARALGAKYIDELPPFFHRPPAIPDGQSERFRGLGSWMAACQAAIFEILYMLREPALPLLRKVAFGNYDWTQANAVDILCRFGIEGLEREAIAREIAQNIPDWRYELIMYSINSLAKFALYAPPVAQALRELIEESIEEDPIDTLSILEPLVQYAPDEARKYTPLLREIMQVHGREQRHPLLDGHVMSFSTVNSVTVENEIENPTPQDIHAIRAAFLLRDLIPEDTEAEKNLRSWALHHTNETIRKQIDERLSAST
ncbi:hypothetical protein CCAX7_008570 [Capsulimonas corticalis]|uniref:Uncharacterized protein n=1 Tax=Capsulimonas corticalis TaxID=2219043 RepID=A0A402CU02_9BACT|nr:hypothetical protein [Capsulimonas corticalis]BDI28806.1 hypothetical protein CCAX7_008570 [Capsulimonas corticalis]